MLQPYRHLDAVYKNLSLVQSVLGPAVRISEWGTSPPCSWPSHVLRVAGMKRALPRVPARPSDPGQVATIPGFLFHHPGVHCPEATANEWPTLITYVAAQGGSYRLSPCLWCHLAGAEPTCIVRTITVPLGELDHDELRKLQVIPCGRGFPSHRGKLAVESGALAAATQRQQTWPAGALLSGLSGVSQPPTPVTLTTGGRARQSAHHVAPPPSASSRPVTTTPRPTAPWAPRLDQQPQPTKRRRSTSSSSVVEIPPPDPVAALRAKVHHLETTLAAFQSRTDGALAGLRDEVVRLHSDNAELGAKVQSLSAVNGMLWGLVKKAAADGKGAQGSGTDGAERKAAAEVLDRADPSKAFRAASLET